MENTSINGKAPILLVEDDRVDAMTVKRAAKEINLKNKLEIRANGEEALEYLKDENNEKPCLILLDLNMPRMNGKEFLNIIKKDTDLKSIPVVVLTTSNEIDDKKTCFDHSVAGYMIKPVDFSDFIRVMKSIKDYWSTSRFPG